MNSILSAAAVSLSNTCSCSYHVAMLPAMAFCECKPYLPSDFGPLSSKPHLHEQG